MLDICEMPETIDKMFLKCGKMLENVEMLDVQRNVEKC